MVLAVLDVFDFLIIGILIAVLTGGTAIASRRSPGDAATAERLRRIEDKLNLLLSNNGIDYVPRNKERWQRLAEGNDQQSAVKEYSETQSVSEEEATQVVDQYLGDINGSS